MISYILFAPYTLLFMYFYRHRSVGRETFLAFILVPAVLLLGLRGLYCG